MKEAGRIRIDAVEGDRGYYIEMDCNAHPAVVLLSAIKLLKMVVDGVPSEVRPHVESALRCLELTISADRPATIEDFERAANG